VQFVVVAPGAGSVALVGDFNDWDSTATPMHATRNGGLWSITLPLAPGRYRYAFLVNGSRWLPDPAAPRAQDDFDAPSSVVTVGG
jgi:1,4-alpha-glucan branching enzyme